MSSEVGWTAASLFGLLVLCLVVVLGYADMRLKPLLAEPLRAEMRLADTQIGHLLEPRYAQLVGYAEGENEVGIFSPNPGSPT